jgi:ATP/maltotriose-dependent transcriptional regulator MalT
MLTRALQVFTSFEDSGGIAWTVGTVAFVRLLQGRLAESRAICAEILPRAREMGDRFGEASMLTIGAMAASDLGDITAAETASARAVALFAEIGDTWGQAAALVARAMAAQARGDMSAAADDLRTSIAMSERARQPSTRVPALSALAWTSYWARDLDGAETAARQAIAVASSLGLEPHAEIGPHVVLALVDRARGNLDDALRVLGEIAETPERPTFLFPMRQALAHYAGTLLDRGRPEEALDAARRAVATPAEDVRSRVIALRALGSALRANGLYAEAEKALRAAVEEASSTEQAQERAATEAALADLLASPLR